MEKTRIRNFSIIAHIDHGKSTLADRMLQLTGTISERDMHEQVLDDMELERERGVTIKASAVRMNYAASDGETYEMNLIDTPGHVDFAYEVSRALQACEGAVLVVDSTQGIEAQTLANLYMALEQDLEIVAVVNKTDLPAARPDEIAQEIEDLIGIDAADVLQVSAKTGRNVEQVLEAIVRHIPPPRGNVYVPARALIFDSHYDSYKGVIAYVRVFDGTIRKTDALRMMATDVTVEPVEIGVFSPGMTPVDSLTAGEVGESFDLDCSREKDATGSVALDAVVLATTGLTFGAGVALLIRADRVDAHPLRQLDGGTAAVVLRATEDPRVSTANPDVVWLRAQVHSVDDRPVRLSSKEFGLLGALAAEPTRVFSKEELLRDVWGYRSIGHTRTLEAHASRLRRKLDPERGRYVVNCWGVGYRLVGP